MSEIRVQVDFAVVGGGPAGLTAAVTAAEGGAKVALIDFNARVGGQYWRHGAGEATPIGQHHTTELRSLIARLKPLVSSGRVRDLLGQQVWNVAAPNSPSGAFSLRTTATTGTSDRGYRVEAQRLLVATGAYDRQLPIPGWTLPGVVAAGGAQALLKEHGYVVGKRIAVGGTGPFLLSVAAGLARAGAAVVSVCEYNSPLLWARTPIGTISQPGKAGEGAQYVGTFIHKRIPYLPRHVITEIHGSDHVTGVTIAKVGRNGTLFAHRTKQVDAVALGWGFTPQLELLEALGASMRVDSDGSLVARVDHTQRSSVPGLYVAGEATGVGGATKAMAEGEVAGLTVLHDVGLESHTSRVTQALKRVARANRFAHALHNASPLPANLETLIPDSVAVCRCEEVTAGVIRAATTELETATPRDGKITTRAGMGRCQGRECGLAVSCLSLGTDTRNWSIDALRPTQKRAIATPISLGALAELDLNSSSGKDNE